MLSSSSFDATDRSPRRAHDQLVTPSTSMPNASELSTPVMSQQKSLNFFLSTPPLLYPIKPAAVASSNDGRGGADPSDRNLFTPSIVDGRGIDDRLEPPAWEPPEADEVEYTDAWNNIYNNQHHFLQPSFTKDDSSIGSNLTNNSLTNRIVISNAPVLRPRGISVSITDAGSLGSCSQTRRGRSQHHRGGHHRISSLPVSFFSSQRIFHNEHANQFRSQTNNRQYLNALQSTRLTAPYELHSHYNESQAKADGAMGGLDGILLDLYMVDRSVDSATAKMLATKGGMGSGVFGGERHFSSEKSRRTSLGTLNDIRCILELHKVDKIVDRFKRGLQMPEFVEEEAWEVCVFKGLRRTDVEMEEYTRKVKSREQSEETGKVPYGFDGIDGDEDGDRGCDRGIEDEDNIMSDESFVADRDAYRFFDPHEIEVLEANSYHHSRVSASIHNDLHEIIDLLRTDLEVNGASRRQKEMEMIKPLLEIDLRIYKSRERLETRVLWDEDLKALYMTDLEVDGARRKCALAPQKVGVKIDIVHSTADSSTDSTELRDPLPPVESPTPSNNQVREDPSLYRHMPRVLEQSDPTARSEDFTLPPSATMHSPLPPPAPVSSPQPFTKRAIFSAPGNVDALMTPVLTTTKRSIFSSKEKSAAVKCTFQGGIITPGTTVVLAKGGEMIGDIPVGKVVMR